MPVEQSRVEFLVKVKQLLQLPRPPRTSREPCSDPVPCIYTFKAKNTYEKCEMYTKMFCNSHHPLKGGGSIKRIFGRFRLLMKTQEIRDHTNNIQSSLAETDIPTPL